VEFEGKIDTLSYHCGLTRTKLIDGIDEKMKNDNKMTIEPTRCAVVAFRDIGVTTTTCGDIRHDLPKPPASIFSKIFFKISKEQY